MADDGQYALLCLENPLLDIQGKGDEALLAKYGLKANDAILAEEKHMGLYEDLLQNHDAVQIAGGAAQNSARGAQYMLPPASVVYVGCVGRDKYAATLRAATAAAGLKTLYLEDATAPTGRCGVIITGQNRSMATDLAAANRYREAHLRSADAWAHVQRARLFYVGGFHLTVCVPAVLALAHEAAAQGKVFVLNLSAPFIPLAFKDALDQTAPYWDVLLGNETEAAAYAEAHGLGTADVKAVARHIAALPKQNTARARTVVITQGTDPTVVATGPGGTGESSVSEFPVHAIETEKINDTNGAGDAFAGGFLAGMVEGKPLETCVDMGHWLARLSIQELGPSYPFPKQTYTGA